MKNKYNIEEIEHNEVDSYQGFRNAVSGVVIVKKIDDLSCDDFYNRFKGLTCKELKAMRKLEKGLAL